MNQGTRQMQMHTYTMRYTSPEGKVDTYTQPLHGDNEARTWGKWTVERSGGTVSIPLQDGTVFVWPAP